MGADPSRSNDPAELPTAISGYLVAHTARDTAAALATLAADAAVTDEGKTYRGHAEIGRWLTGAASEYTYTTELLGAQRTDADRWTVRSGSKATSRAVLSTCVSSSPSAVTASSSSW
ncbi:hypothetical protein SMICM304S_07395 [Streptomyces microflavus]